MGKRNRRYRKAAATAKPAAQDARQNGATPAPAANGNGAAAAPTGAVDYAPAERLPVFSPKFFDSAQRPYRLVPRVWKEEAPHLFTVFFLVLLLYAFTTPHKVALEDDGLFISNLKFFGVAHPPGYPIHTFLGGIFYHLLPFGAPAFKGHMFSGFAGAVACSAIYAIVAMLLRGRVFAYLGGLAYGASKTFWSQAIIAEVYTLNAMFFFIILALCIYYASHSGRSGKSHTRLLVVIAFLYGIAIANHYPILFLGSTGLGLLVLSQLKNILSGLPRALFMLFLGAAPPYAWMVWRSFEITPANFYGPIETWDNFLFYFLRSGYSGVDKQAGVGLEDKIIFSKALGDDMLWQFTPLGFAFVVVGFFAMARSRYQWLCLSLFVSWFTSSVSLVYLLDFKATFIWLAAFRVYHLLAFGIMAIWLAFGAAWVARFLRGNARSLFAGAATLAVVAATVAAHWQINNRRDYTWAHDLAMAKINSVEPNAVLFTFDDLDLPVGYLHFVENVRPDLTVYNDQGLVYGGRLFSPLIPDFAPEGNPNVLNKSGVLKQFMEKTERPIYYHPQRRHLYQHPRFGSDFTGFMRRVNRDNNQERLILSDSLRTWLDANIGLRPNDLWTRQQHFATVAQVINAILIASAHGFPLDDKWQEVIERARDKNAMARLITNMHRLPRMSEEEREKELVWTKTYDIDAEALLGEKMKSQFFVLRANLLAQKHKIAPDERHEDFEAALMEGLARDKSDGNPALQAALAYFLRTGQDCRFIATSERFYPTTEKMPTPLLRQLRQIRKKAVCPPNETA